VTFTGGAGADTIAFSNVGHAGGEYALASGDKVDGGAGRDTLLLMDVNLGGAAVDADFTGVSHVERIAIQGFGNLTLGVLAEQAGVEEVDAGAGSLLVLQASGFSSDLMVRGSKSHDQITLGAGDDTIIGGAGNDLIDGGLGDDTFVYQAVTDSFLGAGHNKGQADQINNFDHTTEGDVIDLTKLDVAHKSAANVGGFANFTQLIGQVDATGFNTDSVLVGSDGADTYVFVDTDNSGAYEDTKDLVIKVTGFHEAELTSGGGLLL
jgi:Ca2+-binding RTX toxin-like protein